MGRPYTRLGVDVVEFRKTKSLYKNHSDRLSRFLTKSETDFVKKDRQPHVALALLLGAKEAAFKAVRPAWLGATPFKDIEILSAQKCFSPKFKGATAKNLRSKTRLELFFLKQKNFVIVQCAGIS